MKARVPVGGLLLGVITAWGCAMPVDLTGGTSRRPAGAGARPAGEAGRRSRGLELEPAGAGAVDGRAAGGGAGRGPGAGRGAGVRAARRADVAGGTAGDQQPGRPAHPGGQLADLSPEELRHRAAPAPGGDEDRPLALLGLPAEADFALVGAGVHRPQPHAQRPGLRPQQLHRPLGAAHPLRRGVPGRGRRTGGGRALPGRLHPGREDRTGRRPAAAGAAGSRGTPANRRSPAATSCASTRGLPPVGGRIRLRRRLPRVGGDGRGPAAGPAHATWRGTCASSSRRWPAPTSSTPAPASTPGRTSTSPRSSTTTCSTSCSRTSMGCACRPTSTSRAGGPLVAGPLWDFDRSSGTPFDDDYSAAARREPREWARGDGTHPLRWGFWGRLFADPAFKAGAHPALAPAGRAARSRSRTCTRLIDRLSRRAARGPGPPLRPLARDAAHRWRPTRTR